MAVNIIMEKSTFTGRDSSGKEHYRAVMLADTTDELPTREWNGIVLEQGSSITSIGEGAEYMMNSAGAWVRQGGGAPEPTLIEKTITENGEYDPADDDADGYSSVSVDVEPNLTTKSITTNGEYAASADNADGYSSVSVDVQPQFSATPKDFKLMQNIRNLIAVIPNGVTSIGNSAFNGCTGLTSVDVPSSVKLIDAYAFYGCTGLTSVEIPDEVTGINTGAFQGCTGLTDVDIGNGVTDINSSAFYGCTGLTSINIPSSVRIIGSNTFDGCTNLAQIIVHKAEGSISGAPWGATNATVTWTG